MFNVMKIYQDKAAPFHWCLIMGLFFFFYALIMTYNIPYFWEDLLFLEGAHSQSTLDLLDQTFTLGTENFSHPGIPLTLLFLNAITNITGDTAIFFRIVRCLFLSGIVIFFYLMLCKFNINKKQAVVMTIVAGFSYPLFLTTFFIPRPEIFGLFWEYCGLFFSFHVFFENEKLSKIQFYFYQAGVFIFLFIAMKMFSPSYFIVPILFLFILLMDYKQLSKFILLICFLSAIYFPLNTEIIHGNVGSYTLGSDSIKYMFSQGSIWSFFSFNNLYYKTLPEVLTPFGILVVFFDICVICYFLFYSILSLLLKLLRVNKTSEEKVFWSSEKEKAFVIFMSLMVLFNIFFIFAAPDPATRYIVFFIMPLLSLMIFFVFKGIEILKIKSKPIIAILIICICMMVFYNMALSVMFRFTWGSAFIGMDKVSSFIEALPDKKIVMFYYDGSPADEYAPIYLLNGIFFKKDKLKIVEKHWEVPINTTEYALASQDGEVYIIKRQSSFGRTVYPSYNFTDPNFMLITTIKGENSIVDSFFVKFAKAVHVSYDFNTFYIYKWAGQE